MGKKEGKDHRIRGADRGTSNQALGLKKKLGKHSKGRVISKGAKTIKRKEKKVKTRR